MQFDKDSVKYDHMADAEECAALFALTDDEKQKFIEGCSSVLEATTKRPAWINGGVIYPEDTIYKLANSIENSKNDKFA